MWQAGVVLTAAHTIRRESDIAVVLPDGSRTAATLAGAPTGLVVNGLLLTLVATWFLVRSHGVREI